MGEMSRSLLRSLLTAIFLALPLSLLLACGASEPTPSAGAASTGSSTSSTTPASPETFDSADLQRAWRAATESPGLVLTTLSSIPTTTTLAAEWRVSYDANTALSDAVNSRYEVPPAVLVDVALEQMGRLKNAPIILEEACYDPVYDLTNQDVIRALTERFTASILWTLTMNFRNSVTFTQADHPNLEGVTAYIGCYHPFWKLDVASGPTSSFTLGARRAVANFDRRADLFRPDTVGYPVICFELGPKEGVLDITKKHSPGIEANGEPGTKPGASVTFDGDVYLWCPVNFAYMLADYPGVDPETNSIASRAAVELITEVNKPESVQLRADLAAEHQAIIDAFAVPNGPSLRELYGEIALPEGIYSVDLLDLPLTEITLPRIDQVPPIPPELLEMRFGADIEILGTLLPEITTQDFRWYDDYFVPPTGVAPSPPFGLDTILDGLNQWNSLPILGNRSLLDTSTEIMIRRGMATPQELYAEGFDLQAVDLWGPNEFPSLEETLATLSPGVASAIGYGITWQTLLRSGENIEAYRRLIINSRKSLLPHMMGVAGIESFAADPVSTHPIFEYVPECLDDYCAEGYRYGAKTNAGDGYTLYQSIINPDKGDDLHHFAPAGLMTNCDVAGRTVLTGTAVGPTRMAAPLPTSLPLGYTNVYTEEICSMVLPSLSPAETFFVVTDLGLRSMAREGASICDDPSTPYFARLSTLHYVLPDKMYGQVCSGAHITGTVDVHPSPASAEHVLPPERVNLWMGPTSVYYGYSPSTTDVFRGVVDYIWFDPDQDVK